MILSSRASSPAQPSKTPPSRARWALAVLLLAQFLAQAAFAQQAEVFTLKYRSANDLLPVVKPLVEPGGSVSALANQLIVRTSPANLAQVRKVISALDHAPRRLRVTLREDNGETDGSSKIYSTRTLDAERSLQQVQVVEGGKAFFKTGQSVPVPGTSVAATPAGVLASQNVAFRDLSAGFFATPSLSGEQVTVEISAVRDTLALAGSGTGAADTQTLITTVSGKLGDWIEVAAVGASPQADSGSVSTHSIRSAGGERRILLKVEELH